jgi:hypothetical protein
LSVKEAWHSNTIRFVEEKSDHSKYDAYAFVPILFPGFIKGADLNLLEKCRGAFPFDQNAFWIQDVSFKGTLGQFRNPNMWNWSTRIK